MSRTVAAYQPRYFPRLHYLNRIHQSDVFIVYDDVEFSRRSGQHRAPIEFESSDWLTIPVSHTGEELPIAEVPIHMATPWIGDHLGTLRHKYGPAMGFLESHYRELVPSVPEPAVVREAAASLEQAMDPEERATLDAFTRYDSRWRQRRNELEQLESRKETLGRRIERVRSADRVDDADALIAETRAVSSRIEPLEARVTRLKERGDRALVRLSEEACRECDVELMDPDSLWDLGGVESDELVGEPRLVDLTIPLLVELVERFDVETTLVRSSELDVDHPGDPSVYLARLTAAVDGDVYVSGREGYENYVDETAFHAEDVDVAVQEWEPAWKAGNVCALDVLFEASEPTRWIR